MALTSVSEESFLKTYRQAVGEIVELIPTDLSAIAKHNLGWASGGFDQYLRDSEARYGRALRAIRGAGGNRILDVGGFLAAFPLALQRCGYQVAIAEKFGYYGGALDGIADCLRRNGIEVIDIDFTEAGADLAAVHERFDCATCMAVAEHLAHTPRPLLENIRSALRPGGGLVFEVPNIAFWPRRFSFFFRGNTVLSPIEHVYHSAIPFTGHHREYTLADARYVVGEAGFSIVAEQTFNYSIDTTKPMQVLKYLPALTFKEWAELILLDCRKSI